MGPSDGLLLATITILSRIPFMKYGKIDFFIRTTRNYPSQVGRPVAAVDAVGLGEGPFPLSGPPPLYPVRPLRFLFLWLLIFHFCRFLEAPPHFA